MGQHTFAVNPLEL